MHAATMLRTAATNLGISESFMDGSQRSKASI